MELAEVHRAVGPLVAALPGEFAQDVVALVAVAGFEGLFPVAVFYAADEASFVAFQR